MAASEAEVAAKLIERLLADPAFRARFRRDPAGACREAGLDELAEEMAVGGGKAMHTLDLRESKSSLAGVMMAAAMEGVGLYELTENVLPHLEHVPGHVADVLSRVDLPAIPGLHHGGGAAAHAAEAAPGGAAPAGAAAGGGPAADSVPTPPAAADAAAAPPGGGAADAAPERAAHAGAPSAAAPPAGAPDAAAAPGGAHAAAHTAGSHPGAAAAPKDSAADKAAKKIAESVSPHAAHEQAASDASSALDSHTTGVPESSDLPSGGGAGHVLDPTQFGQAGSGGPPSAEALALLHNKNVVLDGHGVSDLEAGRVDPRVVGVLTKLSQEHKITVSNLCSEQFTTGGSVSTHHLGRSVDISAIDGHVVDAGNPIARDVASELSSLEPGIRPTEIGSPWAISGQPYFTDATHHNLIHIGFKDPIAPDWKPPADVAAPSDAAATGAAPSHAAADAAAPSDAAAAGAAPSHAAADAAAPSDAAAAGSGVPSPPPATDVPAPPPAAPAPAEAVPASAPAPAAPALHGPSDEQFFDQAIAARPERKVGAGEALFAQAVDPKRPAGGAVAQAASASAPGGAADAAAASVAGGPDVYPGDNASQAQIAAWMAAEAQKRGLPAQLPVMASLVESGVKNLSGGDRDSVGFFQMRVGTWNQGAYAGFPDHPELQLKWFLDQAEAVKAQRIARGESVTDPHQFGDWIADVERPAEQYRGRYQLRLDEANGLLAQHATAAPAPAAATAVADQTTGAAGTNSGAADAAGALTPTAPATSGGSPLGAAALQIAESQKGVHEIGSTNTGPQVDQYLAAAGVSPGNPWCASFVTWSLEHAGHKMPGSGWAAVATWVHNAEQHQNGLQIIPPDQARPGDIVAYDWGGGTDFSSDGHIGFLASNVQNGQFNALEGNNADAVNLVPRHLGGGPNIVFIRLNGNTPTGTTPPDLTPTPTNAPAIATAATAPTPPTPALHGPSDEQFFDQAIAARPERKVGAGDAMFIKAIDPSQQVKPAAGTPAPAAPAPVAAAASAPPPDGSAPAEHAAAAVDLTSAATDYPGDNATQAQIAQWLGAQAQKAGLPPELPVMASLVESGLRNLDYGDRDSVGFFQMRTGIWDQGPYAGFQHRPELQAKWFIDHALAVKRQAIARGDANFGQDPASYGEWIADTEQCAAEFRARYQLRLDEARSLLSS